MVRAFSIKLDNDIALFEVLYGRYRDARRVKVQLAPANLHWCSDDEIERRKLSKSLLPHVRAFYANYFDPDQHAPFYRQSARQ